ncbi:hypothetical protein ACB092_08G026000 [Castanea dentata]
MIMYPSSSSSSISHKASHSFLVSSSIASAFNALKNSKRFIFCAIFKEKWGNGVVVKKELLLVPTVPHVSLARQKYTDQSEAAINDHINLEYNVSYVCPAMYAYFVRDNVALKGLANKEDTEHAEKLMEYPNKRGGIVKLQSILMPLSEFDHIEKGDAMHAMELALSLEKLNNEKLLNLQSSQ